MAVTTATGFVSSVLIAREFGRGGKGLLTLLFLVRGLGALAATTGLDGALIHYGRQRGEFELKELTSSSLAGSLTLGILVAASTVAVVSVGWGSSGEPLEPYILLFLATGALVTVSGVLGAGVRVQGELLESSILLGLQSIFFLVWVTVAVLMGGGTNSIFVGGAVVATGYCAALWIRAAHSRLLEIRKVRISALRLLLRFGFRSHLGTLAENLAYRADVLLVGIIGGVAAAGIYSVALAASEVVQLIPTAFSVLIMQKAAWSGIGSADISAKLLRLTSGVTIMALILLGLVGPTVIRHLFGAEFGPATKILPFLLPGAWSLGMWKGVSALLVGKGHPGAKTHSAFLAAGALIAGDLILVPAYGLVAAAAISTFAYTLGFLVAARKWAELTGESVVGIVLPRGSDCREAFSSIAFTRKRRPK